MEGNGERGCRLQCRMAKTNINCLAWVKEREQLVKFVVGA